MSFAQPFFLYALVLVPLAFLCLLWAERARRQALMKIGQPSLVQRLAASVNVRGRYWKYGLWLGALALLLLALARPQWGETKTSAPQRGVQVMVALDVSSIPEGKLSGESRAEFINAKQTVNDITALAGTIGYEIFTRIGQRVKRVYR